MTWGLRCSSFGSARVASGHLPRLRQSFMKTDEHEHGSSDGLRARTRSPVRPGCVEECAPRFVASFVLGSRLWERPVASRGVCGTADPNPGGHVAVERR
ncbi:hypothetical protein FQA47_008243 [Oryzias melastigma]|uniref:Uncharacterized protein n=1 Tax=Oryzias melastigma TaxID=30732 RepID=A0A834F6M8_ORYME|nr:hypothetical protein FQA47_008243 [Oryzias melastigma]